MAGAVVWSVANWLGTQLITEGNFLRGIEDQVRSLKQELECFTVYLTEAESGEEGKSVQLRQFTERIREIAFRAEDGLDNYILNVASASKTNIGGNFLTKLLCCLCDSADEKEAIHSCIQEAVEQLKQFQNPRLIAIREGINQPRPNPSTIRTYPHTEDAYFVGRDEDVKNLLPRLICCMDTRVVAIVGAGGIGKTTLARKIYTDRRVQNHFKTLAWVTISQQWNQKDLLFDILRQTRGISDEESNSIKKWSEQELVEAIHGFLSQRSYLLVLDDMWDREAWNCIYPAVSSKAFGSKVIITTRKEDLPSQLVDQKCIIHRPQLLTEEQSWQLFQKIALEKKDTQVIVDDDVIQLAREMTQKCDGLPLAVVTLAGLLRTKDTHEWEGVSSRFNSILLNVQGPSQYGRSVYQTLTLSYYDLPHYVKPCFLYLALFPEDYVISCEMLTRMWVAEGFVTTHGRSVEVNESMEDAADRFLNELIQRCVVQVVSTSFTTGKAKECRLHDLTREFCIAKAEEQCFLRVFSSTNRSNTTTSTPTQTRRALIHDSEISVLTHHAQIRSFIQFGSSEEPDQPVAQYKDFKLLRVLILYKAETGDGFLPKEIGNLRHLRYLALIFTNVKTLPESIGNLSNLLYLEYVTSVDQPVILPNVFWKMKSLRHLHFDPSSTCEEELKLHTLTNLQTLRTISGSNCKLEGELERLSPSIKRLRVADVLNEGMLDALFRSPCMTSGNLVKLRLEWNEGVELKNMEPLYKHCKHLQRLELSGNIGQDCPLIQFPPSLVSLDLNYSELDQLHDPMVAAGRLGRLKFLLLGNNAYRGAEMTCNSGSFPQLELLIIESLRNLEEWRVEEGAMPRLKKLTIDRCFKLKQLPEKLKFIHSLGKLEILCMPKTFRYRLFRQGQDKFYEYRAGAENQGEGGEDFHIIQRISHVSFRSFWPFD